MQPSKAQLLCESASQPPSTGSYSMSNLTAFRYEAGQANSQKNDWQVSRVSNDFMSIQTLYGHINERVH
jgi:hypothetical protein